MDERRDANPAQRQPGTAAERRRFLAAIGLFLVWVAALGTMAAVSGRRPAPVQTPAEAGVR
jgi:hypothetical protein